MDNRSRRRTIKACLNRTLSTYLPSRRPRLGWFDYNMYVCKLGELVCFSAQLLNLDYSLIEFPNELWRSYN